MRHDPCETCNCTGTIISNDPEIDDYDCEKCNGLGYIIIDEIEERATEELNAGDNECDRQRDNSI